MTPLAVALLLAATQGAAPPPSSGPGPNAASTSAPDAAAALAGPTFAFGCLQRLGVAASAAEFARGSDALGAQFARDYPVESTSVRLDGADGRGCRVRYTGPSVDRLWIAFAGVLDRGATPGRGGCTVAQRTDTRIRAACVDTATAPPHRGGLVMERSGGGASGSVVVALSWLPPTG